MTITKGSRVRVITVGTVLSMHERSRGIAYYVALDDPAEDPDEFFFWKRDLAVVGSDLATQAWREIAADAIRAGDDKAALRLMLAESDVIKVFSDYIDGLEKLHHEVNMLVRYDRRRQNTSSVNERLDRVFKLAREVDSLKPEK